MANLIERHRKDIRGVLSCLDRVVIQGTIPSICHPKAMATMLDSRGIRLFDNTQFVQPFRDAIRAHAEKVAAEEGVTVEYIRRMKTFRKEDRIREILTERGDHPGLVHIFSAMSRVRRTSLGTTRPPATRSCGGTAASASITTSTSSTRYSVCASWPFRPRVRSERSCTSTVTTG